MDELENAEPVEVYRDCYDSVYIVPDELYYYSAVRTTDLDSASGAEGLVLVELRTIIPPRDRTEYRSILSPFGKSFREMLELPRRERRIELAYLCLEYGQSDPYNQLYEPSEFVIVVDPEADRRTWDGWTDLITDEYGEGEEAFENALNEALLTIS